MLTEIQPFHLIEWKAFFERRPFGDERRDVITAINTIALINGSRGGDVKTSDLLPYAVKPPEVFLSPQEVKERFSPRG